MYRGRLNRGGSPTLVTDDLSLGMETQFLRLGVSRIVFALAKVTVAVELESLDQWGRNLLGARVPLKILGGSAYCSLMKSTSHAWRDKRTGSDCCNSHL